jgi:hypothetical protein
LKSVTRKLTPTDYSTVRGANYRGAAATNTTHYWLNYNAAETERDLTYADRLKLNQLRVFVNHASWQADKRAFRKNLIDLARACGRHRIGLMITLGDTATFINEDGTINRENSRLIGRVSAIGKRPGAGIWDASSRPTTIRRFSPDGQSGRDRALAAATFQIGPANPGHDRHGLRAHMEARRCVDVLSFHDYPDPPPSNDIARARAFAARRVTAPEYEIGCIARANPYDVTLEEHMNAKVGWYIWELMITKRWGDVHGVFYPDGSVRDPSIPAAMFGLFAIVLTRFRRTSTGRAGLILTLPPPKRAGQPRQRWNEGLDARKNSPTCWRGQLIAMRSRPPAIRLMRQGRRTQKHYAGDSPTSPVAP